MASLTYEISGENVTVAVTITEVDGALTFDLAVAGDTGTIGDLNALFLDIADEGLIDGLTATGSDVTGTAFKEDGVTKISNFTNINGEVVKDLGKFDLGVQFGSQGMAEDDIQSTSFTLSHATDALSLEDFMLMDSALRLTSVGEADGAREDSLKLGGVVDPVEVVEDDPVDDTPTDDDGPVIGDDFPEDEGPVVGDDIPDNEGPVIGDEFPEDEGPTVGDDTPGEDGPVIGDEFPVDEGPVINDEFPVDEGPVIHDEFPEDDSPVIGDEVPFDEGPVIGDDFPLYEEEAPLEFDFVETPFEEVIVDIGFEDGGVIGGDIPVFEGDGSIEGDIDPTVDVVFDPAIEAPLL